MTNTINNPTKSNDSSNDNNDSSNDNNSATDFMKSFRELIGYDLHTSKTVFDHAGAEIVFVHEMLIGMRRVYIDGKEVFSGFSLFASFHSDIEVANNHKQYRLVSFAKNWATLSQDITLYVDGVEAGRKFDPMYEGLSSGQQAHAFLGVLGIGLLLGTLLRVIF